MLARKRPGSATGSTAMPVPLPAEGRGGSEVAPTMIIPRGTEIKIDGHGQLSIRSPGNLVLQNSGSYGSLESVAGSIRIERDWETVKVVDGAATSFRDEGIGDGAHRYRIFARKAGRESFPAAVIVPPAARP